jgi:dolichol-phosphate mannosyltransferase
MILQSASISRTSDTLVFAPTFNERQTICPLLDDLLSLQGRFDVLIVDDLSCDGTAEYLTARAATDPRLRLIMRPGKFGVGSAHKLAWLQARQHGYSRLVTLDADLSHDPQDVSRVLALLDGGADVAFGSRFLPGGRLDYRGGVCS